MKAKERNTYAFCSVACNTSLYKPLDIISHLRSIKDTYVCPSHHAFITHVAGEDKEAHGQLHGVLREGSRRGGGGGRGGVTVVSGEEDAVQGGLG